MVKEKRGTKRKYRILNHEGQRDILLQNHKSAEMKLY